MLSLAATKQNILSGVSLTRSDFTLDTLRTLSETPEYENVNPIIPRSPSVPRFVTWYTQSTSSCSATGRRLP